MSFPPPIESLTLRVTTGVYPDVQPFEQTILSANMGSNSIPIHNTSLTSAFNTQPPGTIFNASIVTTYNEGTFTTGDTISTPSLLNFVPKPLVLSNFGPFIYNYVSGGVGTFTLPQPSSNSNSPGAFTYSVVDTNGVVSVSTNVVTMLSAGTTTIRATQAAAGSYTSAFVNASVTINPIAPTFSNGGVFTIANKNFGASPFTPTYLTSNSSGAFTYTSITPSVASVHPTTGVVTIVSAGTTTIRATQAAAGGYTSAYFEATLTINPIAPTFSNGGVFTIANRDLGDAPFTPTYLTSNSSGAFTYTSSTPSVASVHSTTGLVTIVSVGTTTITATQAAAGNYTSAYFEDSFNVMTWSQRGQDIDGERINDNSGGSVSLSSSGNTLAIGAHLNDGAGTNAGHARIYDWDTVTIPNQWTKRGLDIDGEVAVDYSGISVSLSSDGNIVAIGAHYNDGSGSNAGHVRVYYWDTVSTPNKWTKRGSDIDGETAEDNSGISVSLSSDGNTVAIGATYNDSTGSNAGNVRIYDWDTVAWIQRGLDIDGEAANDNSGVSVSLSSDGNTVAIGARYNDGAGTNAGHARVYDWDTVATPNKWTKRGSDIDGETGEDNSGISVSLSSDGNTVAVGARYNDGADPNSDRGHVRIYDWDTVATPNKWTQRGLDIDGETAEDNSGFSVSLSSSGNTVAVGGPYNDGTGVDAGHVRVYDWNTVEWTRRGSDIDGEAAGDYSGWSVSLSSDGNILAVGALYNDGAGTNAGHARVFKYE